MEKNKKMQRALKSSAARMYRQGFSPEKEPTENSPLPYQDSFFAALKKQEEVQELIGHMTNHQRHQWAKNGRPGERENDPRTVRAFLELLKELKEQKNG